jgi:hypothetical protein
MMEALACHPLGRLRLARFPNSLNSSNLTSLQIRSKSECNYQDEREHLAYVPSHPTPLPITAHLVSQYPLTPNQ